MALPLRNLVTKACAGTPISWGAGADLILRHCTASFWVRPPNPINPELGAHGDAAGIPNLCHHLPYDHATYVWGRPGWAFPPRVLYEFYMRRTVGARDCWASLANR